MTNLITTLAERGFIQDLTPGAEARVAAGPVTGYIGFDPTADSLHVGNLVPIMGLAWLQRTGGTPVVLVGGGTGMVGDPGGKRTERPILDVEEIDANAKAITWQLRRFVRFDGDNAARVRNNADWLRPLRLMDFLRDVGKHFTVNYMLQKESVKARMETGISFTEFTYMLTQAYDYWHLYHLDGCELQMGGSDQWGNITAGIELIARRDDVQVHGIVFPLLTAASGTKFGKSESGNIWLDPAKTSPYEFYQFWLNSDDRDAERFLKLFTFLPLGEIAAVMEAQASDPASRAAQRLLAREVTALVHGEGEAERAVAASAAVFSPGDDADYAALAGTMPSCALPAMELDGLTLTDVLVRAGLASSKSEARRGIEGKGYSINGVVETDVNRRLTGADLRQGRYVLLRKGKKNHAMLVVE
ncbi:MAG: tyrosine--tRNA ligase [Bacillota bacterium]|jgi:tyrosyl-tRNA synthetase